MSRCLIIPAAGRGSRLNSTTPKVLFPVNGRPMIDYLLELYAPWVDRFVLVVHPSFAAEVEQHCAAFPYAIDFALQETPTGMLDAILIPQGRIRPGAPGSVWITWCDQIAVDPVTITTLANQFVEHPNAALIMPTIRRTEPYIHFVRDDKGEICEIRHRREGDVMPAVGEGDLGLFGLSAQAYLDWLPAFARSVTAGKATQERNFLPFIAWLRGRGEVRTFPAVHEIESIGVNCAADLAQVEKHFLERRVANG